MYQPESWVAFGQVTDDDDGDDVAIASKSTDFLSDW